MYLHGMLCGSCAAHAWHAWRQVVPAAMVPTGRLWVSAQLLRFLLVDHCIWFRFRPLCVYLWDT